VNRDKRQAQISDAVEYTVQGGLVGNGSVEGGRAVAFVGESQIFEPIGPPIIEMSLDFDFVYRCGGFLLSFRHIAPRF
jgi:hypothetical protein